MSVTVERYADRVLRRHKSVVGEERGLRSYFALNHGEYPQWWSSDLSDQVPAALGIIENSGWPMQPSIVITADSIGTIEPGRWDATKYDSIRSIEPLEKSPEPTELVILMHSGSEVRIPVVTGEEGTIFTIFRFLIDARRAVRLAQRG